MISNWFKAICEPHLEDSRLVKSGIEGFPLLEPNKFYVIDTINPWDGSKSISRYRGKILQCSSDNKSLEGSFHSSYLLTTISALPSGHFAKTGEYAWFSKGNNLIFELPEDLAKATQTYWNILTGKV